MHNLSKVYNKIKLLESEVKTDALTALVKAFEDLISDFTNRLKNSTFGQSVEERKNFISKAFRENKLSSLPSELLKKITNVTTNEVQSVSDSMSQLIEKARSLLLSEFDTIMYIRSGDDRYLKRKSFFEKTKLILQKYVLDQKMSMEPEKIIDFLLKASVIAITMLLLGVAIMSTDSAFMAVKKYIFEVSSKFGRSLKELNPVKAFVLFIKLILSPFTAFVVALQKSPIGTVFFTLGVSIISYCGVMLYTYKEYGILK